MLLEGIKRRPREPYTYSKPLAQFSDWIHLSPDTEFLARETLQSCSLCNKSPAAIRRSKNSDGTVVQPNMPCGRLGAHQHLSHLGGSNLSGMQNVIHCPILQNRATVLCPECPLCTGYGVPSVVRTNDNFNPTWPLGHANNDVMRHHSVGRTLQTSIRDHGIDGPMERYI